MTFLILGVNNLSIHSTNAIIESGNQVVAMISIPKKSRPNNSANIALYAKQNDISYYEFEDINSVESLNSGKGVSSNISFSDLGLSLLRFLRS